MYRLAEDELKKTWNSILTVIAEVKKENIASNKFFEKMGFVLTETKECNVWKRIITK